MEPSQGEVLVEYVLKENYEDNDHSEGEFGYEGALDDRTLKESAELSALLDVITGNDHEERGISSESTFFYTSPTKNASSVSGNNPAPVSLLFSEELYEDESCSELSSFSKMANLPPNKSLRTLEPPRSRTQPAIKPRIINSELEDLFHLLYQQCSLSGLAPFTSKVSGTMELLQMSLHAIQLLQKKDAEILKEKKHLKNKQMIMLRKLIYLLQGVSSEMNNKTIGARSSASSLDVDDKEVSFETKRPLKLNFIGFRSCKPVYRDNIGRFTVDRLFGSSPPPSPPRTTGCVNESGPSENLQDIDKLNFVFRPNATLLSELKLRRQDASDPKNGISYPLEQGHSLSVGRSNELFLLPPRDIQSIRKQVGTNNLVQGYRKKGSKSLKSVRGLRRTKWRSQKRNFTLLDSLHKESLQSEESVLSNLDNSTPGAVSSKKIPLRLSCRTRGLVPRGDLKVINEVSDKVRSARSENMKTEMTKKFPKTFNGRYQSVRNGGLQSKKRDLKVEELTKTGFIHSSAPSQLHPSQSEELPKFFYPVHPYTSPHLPVHFIPIDIEKLPDTFPLYSPSLGGNTFPEIFPSFVQVKRSGARFSSGPRYSCTNGIKPINLPHQILPAHDVMPRILPGILPNFQCPLIPDINTYKSVFTEPVLIGTPLETSQTKATSKKRTRQSPLGSGSDEASKMVSDHLPTSLTFNEVSNNSNPKIHKCSKCCFESSKLGVLKRHQLSHSRNYPSHSIPGDGSLMDDSSKREELVVSRRILPSSLGNEAKENIIRPVEFWSPNELKGNHHPEVRRVNPESLKESFAAMDPFHGFSNSLPNKSLAKNGSEQYYHSTKSIKRLK